jgi:hypothetical protein
MDTNPVNYKRKTNVAWLFNMALRDSRKNRSRLFLFISAIVFGIAALVAIYSFRYNVQNDVNGQAASLIGADLLISGNKPVDIKLKKCSIRWAIKDRPSGVLPPWPISQKARAPGWYRSGLCRAITLITAL